MNDTAELVSADLTDAASTSKAVAGSDTAYLSVGMPMDSALWEEKFPVMMRNVLVTTSPKGIEQILS